MGGDASRRHAEILPAEGGFALRDLGSTNGTWVNGERIEERALHPGDRIQIGSTEITFCQVDAGGAVRGDETSRGEAKTILLEQPVPSEVFRGDLAEIPPFAVLQILELGRKTGVLRLDADQGTGEIWLSEGMPIHAETKDQAGFDAAIALAQGTAGRFAFEPRASLPEVTIRASVTEVLLEASRLLDERG
jgi:pSer/pThr/pTyr-binding forkhead associated (FHA) protein